MLPKELGGGSQRWLWASDLMTGLGPEPFILFTNTVPDSLKGRAV